MLYIDCFQLAKACMTAQWIMIRLKLHCKSFFSLVLKLVLSPRATGPKQDATEEHSSERNGEGYAAGMGDLYPRKPDNLHDAFKHQHNDWCGYLLGKGEEEWGTEREHKDHYKGERVKKERERKIGRETEGLGSIHVIRFPLNSCQGPSAAISLMKCSWCYEQSAWRITSRITTQKPRML